MQPNSYTSRSRLTAGWLAAACRGSPSGMRDKKLAAGLGWASLGLGVPQTLAPRRFAEAVGVRPDDRVEKITRFACGLRELQAAAGILKVSDPPTMWIWSRVAGDVFDLYLLASALRNKPLDADRVKIAMGAVGGVLAADLFTAISLTRQNKGEPSPDEQTHEPDEPQVTSRERVAITIRHPREGLERMWREQDFEWLPKATVSMTDAPGDRGTEIHVRLEKAGDDSTVKDDLRRFKQQVETGEVVRAEGTPEGTSLFRNLKQRPAQPQEVKS